MARQPTPTKPAADPPRQAVATTGQASMPAIPDFMKQYAGLGSERISATDVQVPRVKLMQATSKELDSFDWIRRGQFLHDLLEVNLNELAAKSGAPDGSIPVVPLYIDQRFILWRPLETGGGILARADDGVHWNPPNATFEVQLPPKMGGTNVRWKTADTVAKSGLDQWGTTNPADPNSPPAGTRMYNIVVAFPTMLDIVPAVVTLQRSAISVARRFLGKLKVTRAPSFGLIFNMRAVKDSNAVGQEFFNYEFQSAGMVNDEALFREYHGLYELFAKQGLSIRDIEGLQEDDIADAIRPDPNARHPEGAPAF